MRLRLLLVPVLGGAVLACSSVPAVDGPVRAPASREPLALRLLHDWDASRAEAWARGSAVELARLYVPGSALGRSDVALLEGYRRRGATVHGMRMQVLEARVVTSRGRVVRVEVLERFAGAVAEFAHGSRRLPASNPVRRLIDFRRDGTRWLVASVRQSLRPARR